MTNQYKECDIVGYSVTVYTNPDSVIYKPPYQSFRKSELEFGLFCVYDKIAVWKIKKLKK